MSNTGYGSNEQFRIYKDPLLYKKGLQLQSVIPDGANMDHLKFLNKVYFEIDHKPMLSLAL